MKIIKLTIAGLAIAANFSACDNLDYQEFDSQGKEYMQRTYDRVVLLANGVYTDLEKDFGAYSGGMLASACDEAEYAYSDNSVNTFTNGAWSPTNAMSGTWKTSYSLIQRCNHYITEYQGLTFDDLKLNDDYDKQMFRYRNSFYEMQVLRAYCYFNLVRQYGDVPYFTDVLTTDNVNTLTKSAAQEVLRAIMQTCTELATLLPEDYSKLGLDGYNEPGRVSSVTALAIKARAALYAASPLFNPSNDKTLWLNAATANKELIDACIRNGYSLSKYSSLWGPKNYAEKEMIFMNRSVAADSKMEGLNYPIGITGGNSGNCPTQDLVDAYEMAATGLRYDEAGSGYDDTKPYIGRDPRFAMTIVKNGDLKWPSSNTSPIEIFYGGLNAEPLSGATPTGYYLKKYLDPAIDMSANSKYKTSHHSWIVFRLGEFYLNYAEAIFQYTGSADAPGDFGMTAREAVNVIRARTDVKMPQLSTGLSAEDFWKRYQNERRIELAFEGHRFYDIRRWKIADQYKNITEMKLTKKEDGTISYERRTVNRVWEDKMYLFPIPMDEILKNPNLTQNTGW